MPTEISLFFPLLKSAVLMNCLFYVIIINMKIKALNIKTGDRIVAYFRNKMQVCKVKRISTSKKEKTTISVFLGDCYRQSRSGTIRFKSETLVEVVQ